MRIIAGTARGRRIEAPEGMDTRPTLDKVREAVFGKLQFVIPESNVLDMFAGSGAMGLEALSRGAATCTFIDISKKAVVTVKKNADFLGFSDRAVIYKGDSVKILEGVDEIYDFIFIDPPYKEGLYESAFEAAVKHMSDSSVIVCEHDREIQFPPSLDIIDVKRYSGIFITYLTKINSEEI